MPSLYRTPENDELDACLEQLKSSGFVLLPQIFTTAGLAEAREAFSTVYSGVSPHYAQTPHILSSSFFLGLLHSPTLALIHDALFGHQAQLLRFELHNVIHSRQAFGPIEKIPDRSWHRDLSFCGASILASHSLIYLDTMCTTNGPTYVLPSTHTHTDNTSVPPAASSHDSEVPIIASAGDMLILNSGLWHSGSISPNGHNRRVLSVYVGHWWMKQFYDPKSLLLDPATLENRTTRAMLGIDMPAADMHIY